MYLKRHFYGCFVTLLKSAMKQCQIKDLVLMHFIGGLENERMDRL